MIVHLVHRPGPPLDRFIDHLWLTQTPGYVHAQNWLLPDGGVELIFNLGRPHGLVDPDRGALRHFHRAWVSGERRGPILLDTRDGHDLIGVHFRPGGAYPFFALPMAELTDRVIELDEIWNGLVEEIRCRLAVAVEPAARFAVLEAVLTARAKRRLSESLLVDGAVRTLERAAPGTSVRSLAARLGVTHRRLIVDFERWVGLKPKLLQRVLRFQRVITLEDRLRGRVDWARAAAECGYFDQAHLIRDFRAFAGFTPGQYSARRAEYANYVPAAD